MLKKIWVNEHYIIDTVKEGAKKKKQQKSCCFKCKLMHATIILSSGGLKAFKIPPLDIKLIFL